MLYIGFSSLDSTPKSPRLQGRSKSIAVDHKSSEKHLLQLKRTTRSPSLSILPEVTSKCLTFPPKQGSSDCLTNTLLCDENMDGVSAPGSSVNSPEKEDCLVVDEKKSSSKSVPSEKSNSKNEESEKGKTLVKLSKDLSSESCPDSCELTPPASPSPKRFKNCDEDSDESMSSVLKVPIQKLFQLQSGRINDDIYLSDPFKHISWNEGIGTLKNSTIHFKINEYGMHELMSNEEYYRCMKFKLDQDLLEPIGARTIKKKRKALSEKLLECKVCNFYIISRLGRCKYFF